MQELSKLILMETSSEEDSVSVLAAESSAEKSEQAVNKDAVMIKGSNFLKNIYASC